jgi:hypothetical protein
MSRVNSALSARKAPSYKDFSISSSFAYEANGMRQNSNDADRIENETERKFFEHGFLPDKGKLMNFSSSKFQKMT